MYRTASRRGTGKHTVQKADKRPVACMKAAALFLKLDCFGSVRFCAVTDKMLLKGCYAK